MAAVEALELRRDDLERFPMINSCAPTNPSPQQHPAAFVIHH